MDPAEFARRQRRASACTRFLAGEPVTSIADGLGVSVSSVRDWVSATPGLRAERDRRAQERHTQQQAEILEQALTWSRAHPGMPLSQGARMLGMEPAHVAAVLGVRARLHPEPVRRPRIPDAVFDEALRRFVVESSDVRSAAWAAMSAGRGWPSLSSVLARYGTWSAALASVGVEVPGRRGRGRVWTDDQIAGWVGEWFATTEHVSWRAMSTWLREREGPSASLVRNRLGGWTDLCARFGDRAQVP